MYTPNSAQDFKAFLQREFDERCRKNPRYSIRAFARSLGISHAAIIEMLSGKRTITRKSITRIGRALNLPNEEIDTYMAQVIVKKRAALMEQ